MCNRLNIRLLLVISCFQWFKDTKMKANHNCNRIEPKRREAVSNGPVTKMKASHNKILQNIGAATPKSKPFSFMSSKYLFFCHFAQNGDF